MTRFLAKRLGGSVIVLLGLSIITFLLARVVPSNAAAVFIGPKARPDDIARVTPPAGPRPAAAHPVPDLHDPDAHR